LMKVIARKSMQLMRLWLSVSVAIDSKWLLWHNVVHGQPNSLSNNLNQLISKLN